MGNALGLMFVKEDVEETDGEGVTVNKMFMGAGIWNHIRSRPA